MKLAAIAVAGVVALIVSVGGFVVVLTATAPFGLETTGVSGVVTDGSCMDRVLRTIRAVESGGRYTVRSSGGASGAYQIIDSTWAAWGHETGVDTSGWVTAADAPPEVQDRVAAGHVARFLAAGHPIQDIPLAWYWPAALTDPTQLDLHPYPEHNRNADHPDGITPRDYQTHWLAVFAGQPGCPSRAQPSDPVGGWNIPDPEVAAYGNGYIPLVYLVEVEPGRYLGPRTAAAWQAMATAAAVDGIMLTITSAYRTQGEQAVLVEDLGLIANGGLAAPVGESPHGLGIATDIDVVPPGVHAWLVGNAARWCFRNLAPPREPWHWQWTGNTGTCTPST